MLTSKQRADLRGQANSLETIFQIGKGGVTDQLVTGVNQALAVRELIKLRVLESAGFTARQAADDLAEATGADVVQVIGSRMVLYRPAEEPKIKLRR